MKVIAADPSRQYDLPGAPGARRPVDVDASNTGFRNLRSFRVYSFETNSVVDGHAEEDEVFVLVTAGSVEMKIGWEDSAIDAFGIFTLAAPTDGTHPIAAYLPPRSAYRLTPHTRAEVAYARATPIAGSAPAVFSAQSTTLSSGLTTLLLEETYAERLSLSLIHLHAQNAIQLTLPDATDKDAETLVYVYSPPSDNIGDLVTTQGETRPLRSGETIVLPPGHRAALHAANGADLFILTLQAT